MAIMSEANNPSDPNQCRTALFKVELVPAPRRSRRCRVRNEVKHKEEKPLAVQRWSRGTQTDEELVAVVSLRSFAGLVEALERSVGPR
jgi:hypothetical protein